MPSPLLLLLSIQSLSSENKSDASPETIYLTPLFFISLSCWNHKQMYDLLGSPEGGTVLARDIITVMKRHDQNQLGMERVYLAYAS